ncbi:unnamed protein product [Rhizopus stolonifer]
MPRKNTTRTTTASNSGDALLDDSHLVSPVTLIASGSTVDSGSRFNSVHHPFDTMTTDKSQLEALGLEALGSHYQGTGLNNSSVTDFSPMNVINSLGDLHIHKKLQVGTLRLARAAITHFHANPALICNSLDISSFRNTLAEQAPPIRLPKPTINLGPISHQIQKSFRNLSPTFLTCNAN